MATFTLDCDALSSASSSINSLANQMDSLKDSVKGYEVSNEDGFDFETAKSMIVANVNAAKSKVSNTSNLINDVIQTHTALQESLAKGDIPGENKNEEQTSYTPSYGSSSGSSGGRSSSSGGRSSSSYKPYSNKSSKQPSIKSTAPAATGLAVLGNVAKKSKEKQSPIKQQNYIKYSDYGKTFSVSEQNELNKKYSISNSDGYLKIDDRYVVVCDKNIGTTGDKINITNDSGDIYKCVVGKNVDTNSKNNIFLTIDSSKFTNSSVKNINISKVENLGTLETNTNNLGTEAPKTIDSSVNQEVDTNE